MRKLPIIATVLLFSLVLGIGVVKADGTYHISGCQYITDNGTYILDSNMTVNEAPCFTFENNVTGDVVIDLNGHSITFNDENINRMLADYDTPSKVTLKNGIIEVDNGITAFPTDSYYSKTLYINNVTFYQGNSCCGEIDFTSPVNINNSESKVGPNSEEVFYISFGNYENNIINNFVTDLHSQIELNNGKLYNSKINDIMIYKSWDIENTTIMGDILPEEYQVNNIYFYNVTYKNHQSFYCNGCNNNNIQTTLALVENANTEISDTGEYNNLYCVVGGSSNIITSGQSNVIIKNANFNINGNFQNIGVDSSSGYISNGNNFAYYNIYDSPNVTINANNIYVNAYGYNSFSVIKINTNSLENLNVGGSFGVKIFYDGNISNADISYTTFEQILNNINIDFRTNDGYSFSRTIYDVSQTKVNFTDTYGSGYSVDYRIHGLYPNTKYDIYLDGSKAYTMQTDDQGTLGPFSVTFHSPVNIVVEKYVPPKQFDLVVRPYYNDNYYMVFPQIYLHDLSLTGSCAINITYNWNQGCAPQTQGFYYWNGSTNSYTFDCVNHPFSLYASFSPVPMDTCGAPNNFDIKICNITSNGTIDTCSNYNAITYNPNYFIIINNVTLTHEQNNTNTICVNKTIPQSADSYAFQLFAHDISSYGVNHIYDTNDPSQVCVNTENNTDLYYISLDNDYNAPNSNTIVYRTEAWVLNQSYEFNVNDLIFHFDKYKPTTLVRYTFTPYGSNESVTQFLNSSEYSFHLQIFDFYALNRNPSGFHVDVDKTTNSTGVYYTIRPHMITFYTLIKTPIPENFNGIVKFNGVDVAYTIENDKIVIDPWVLGGTDNTLYIGTTQPQQHVELGIGVIAVIDILGIVLVLSGLMLILKTDYTKVDEITKMFISIVLVIVSLTVIFALL